MKMLFGYLSRLEIRLSLVLLLIAGGIYTSYVNAATSGLSRQAIQDYLKRPGNAILAPDWDKDYNDKTVHWQGLVYKVDQLGPDEPVEILIKVLPSSHLYDTVLTLPSNHPLAKVVKPGQILDFQGYISGAVDNPLLKEVHITFSHP